ncbi:hypothetical protein J2797_005144 [Paraburkholderia terricola]|uniref:hypothetical protein n=1 Tax=Paraburkholderia terricola TaxID=169427 RepID=UPI002857CDA6|nr:hypothetical protein [Paraburkholderia terricola]MDR6495228.1 hypothetical protein [Paraburkholderia terricola]
MKRVGCGLLLLACTTFAFAGDHYIKIWNPPEARQRLFQGAGAPKSLSRVRRVPPLEKTRAAHRTPTAATKLAVKQGVAGAGTRRVTRDASEIPRLITPEGNVLRVDVQDSYVEVVR